MSFTDKQIDTVIDEVCKEKFTDTYTGQTQYPNNEQRLAIHLIVNGRNVCLTGPPGTGKTFTSNVLDEVMVRLRPQHTFSRTATTGMASTHITTHSGDEGKTIFKWLCSGSESMIGHTPEFLLKIRTEPQCQRPIRYTDILQIDEASMLNESVIGHLDNAAREIRRNRRYMGGMQVILTGDIHQLGTIDVSQGGGHQRDAPPIPIPSILDNLPEAYEVVILQQMMRSVDVLHQAILKGIVSVNAEVRKRAIEILNNITCPSTINPWDAVQLAQKDGYTIVTYSNKQVDLYNDLERIWLQGLNPDGPIKISEANKLHTWETLSREAKSYLQDEEGMRREEEEIRKRRSFVSNLYLYPGQNIMLRRNQEYYTNGQVARFEKLLETPQGKFLQVTRLADGAIIHIDMVPHTSEYVPQVGFEQYPVIPNAAVTTHKIQGSTLNKVLFDPTSLEWADKDIARLLYTSISRTKNITSIRLTDKIPSSLILRTSVQEALNKLWGLDYMKDYPSISLEELEKIYSEYRIKHA